jgi:hypothetical protein
MGGQLWVWWMDNFSCFRVQERDWREEGLYDFTIVIWL